MDDVQEATASLLADKPDIEESLRELLEIDADGPWTFADAPLDSGAFGEIVARGLVEETDEGYRITDRAAVRAALDGEAASDTDDEAASDTDSEAAGDTLRRTIPSFDRRTVLALVLVLGVLVLIRVGFSAGSVFRGDDIVLFRNDAYFYWRQVEALRLSELGLTDFGSVPSTVAEGDVLFVVVLWWLVGLTGVETAVVLAWYPVVAGVLGALLLYLVAVRLTADRRVAVASVLLVAFVPIHASRTALGFADHDAFDLLWLLLVVFALVVFARARVEDDADDPQWLATVALGVGVAAQAMAWRGGPILLAPVGVYVALLVLADVRADRPPLRSSAGLLAGLALGGLGTVGVHLVWGWLPLFRAVTPLLLFLGAAGVVALAELAHRRDWPVRRVALVEGTLGVLALAALLVIPPLADALTGFVSYFQVTGGRNISETLSMFSAQNGSVIGPVFRFGLLFFLAVPYLAWITFRVYRNGDSGWLVVVVYSWYFLAFATLQQRFAIALSPFVALVGSLGFVHLAYWIDLARPVDVFGLDTHRWIEIPDRNAVVLVVVLFLLVGSLSFVQVPADITNITIDDTTYETGRWLDEYTDEQGLSHPEDTVLTRWDQVRFYNYFSTSLWEPWRYSRNYSTFLASDDPDRWADRLQGTTGFVVLLSPAEDPTAGTMEAALARPLGDGSDLTTSRYRLVHLRPDADIAVYRVVPGYQITGTGPENATLTVRANVTVGDRTFPYRQPVSTNATGQYAVTVPYPDRYRIGEDTVECGDETATDAGSNCVAVG
jgi:dolichyl-diphosphooligosaccharide--protein glycosyltransferase